MNDVSLGDASQSLNYLSHLAMRLNGPNEKNTMSGSGGNDDSNDQADLQLLNGNILIGIKKQRELE